MEAFLGPSRPVNQYYGVYPAIVVDNQDPESRYRVKVKFPWMLEADAKYVDTPDKEEMHSTWCRVTSFLAGSNKHGGAATDEIRGAFFLPEVDDEVLVAFMNGDFREPVVLGQLHNGKDLPMWNNKSPSGAGTAGANVFRGIRSRSGHMIGFVDGGSGGEEKIVIQTHVKDDNVYDQPALGGTSEPAKPGGGTVSVDVPDGSVGGHVISLDMTSGKESVLISDKSGKLLVKFDSVAETMVLYASKDMVINAKENLFIKCKSLKVESDKDTEFKAGTTWKQESGSTMDLKAGGTLKEEAPKIDMNP